MGKINIGFIGAIIYYACMYKEAVFKIFQYYPRYHLYDKIIGANAKTHSAHFDNKINNKMTKKRCCFWM